MELLDREAHPEHDNLRFDLLKWMISEEKLKSCDLRELPGNYLHNILVLVFLTSNEFITTNEADLILLTIKHVEEKSIPKDIFKPEVVDSRAFRVSFMFNMFHNMISDTMEVVGLSDRAVSMSN